MKLKLLAASAILALGACEHPLEIMGTGDITSSSGLRNCLYADHQNQAANCTENVITGTYDETYTATAHNGHKFDRWYNYCEDDLINECVFDVESNIVQAFQGGSASPLIAKFREDTPGYASLFIGHSFFIPFTYDMAGHASNAGYSTHEQTAIFSGGASGAPEALWNNSSKRNQIQNRLNQGDVELFGMTYHPDYPSLTGYQNWIDYALARNPDTKFFIGIPWLPYPSSYANGETYLEDWKTAHSEDFHGLVDALRAQYPNTEIYCVPYGQAAGELYARFENGELSDDLTSVQGNGATAIFTDNLGHGGNILLDLGEYVWLYAIYGVRPAAYNHNHGYAADLRSIAEQIIIEHNPYYDAQ